MKKIIVTQQARDFPSERRGYPLEETLIDFVKTEIPFANELEDDGDYEEFYENYMRLYYVALNYPRENIVIRRGHIYINFDTKQTLTEEETTALYKEPHFIYGMQREIEKDIEELKVSYYGDSPSYIKYANRHVKQVGFPEEYESEEEPLADKENGLIYIKELRNKGIHKFVIKDVRPKHGLYIIDLTNVPNTDEGFIEYIKTYFEENYDDWGMFNLMNNRPSQLVQEFKQMKNEYRFFVINGELVSGAGCIEEHTPLANTKQFNTLVEEYRSKSEITDNPVLIERYLKLATEIVALTTETEPTVKSYSLDMCLYEDDTIGMIERNEYHNSGFYAQDINSIVKAVIKANS